MEPKTRQINSKQLLTSVERITRYRKRMQEDIVNEMQRNQDEEQPSTSRAAIVALEQTMQRNQDDQCVPSLTVPLVEYTRHSNYSLLYVEATLKFNKLFMQNEFGHVCNVCDRLWFQFDLKPIKPSFKRLLQQEFRESEVDSFKLCTTCTKSLSSKKIPPLSVSNGYKYPDHVPNLPPLDLISERLISPRLPFMQIRRLRQHSGTYKIIGQIINIPVDVNNMVQELPRQLDDDYAINISIKKHIIHKSSYLCGQVKKEVVKAWLRYMVTTPLYRFYNITFNENNLNNIPLMKANIKIILFR